MALVELKSITDTEDELPGHASSDFYQGKQAHLLVGLVLKGEAETTSVDLLHFAYRKMGLPNGAFFLDFSGAKQSQYLVFLKKEQDGRYVPVTGHYDAELSMKHIRKDHFSPIASEN